MAEAIRARVDRIVEANRGDVQSAEKAGMAAAMLDRLTLTPARLEGVARAVDESIKLTDPVGSIDTLTRRPRARS